MRTVKTVVGLAITVSGLFLLLMQMPLLGA